MRVIGHLFSPRWWDWFRFKVTQQGPVAVVDHFAACLLVTLGLLASGFSCFFEIISFVVAHTVDTCICCFFVSQQCVSHTPAAKILAIQFRTNCHNYLQLKKFE